MDRWRWEGGGRDPGLAAILTAAALEATLGPFAVSAPVGCLPGFASKPQRAGMQCCALGRRSPTSRPSDLVRLRGHIRGGLPVERILARLGVPASSENVLRYLRWGTAQ